jgi:dTDP-4-dehydrorhamnose reductase
MERILIVGASGLLGNRMMDLWASGNEVSGTYGRHRVDYKNAYNLDVTQEDAVARLMEKISPDLIVDTHGISSIDYCESHKEEASRINVDGTRIIAENAKSSGAKYVFVSTDGVFDGEKKGPYTESDEPHPLNQYGMTKLLAERAVEAISPDHMIIRTSTLFGKGGFRDPPSFASWVTAQLGSRQRIDVVTDQYSNPTYTDNLCDFIMKLHERDATGVFHVAGKDTLSRFEFANKIAEVFGLEKGLINPITTAALGQRAKKPLRVGLDISKAESASAMKGIGIDQALDEFRDS